MYEKIMEKYGVEISDSIKNKAELLLSLKKVSLVSPVIDVRRIHFHICPSFDSEDKRGHAISFTPEFNDWMCSCKYEVFRKEKNKICSHILACMIFYEQFIEIKVEG